MFDNNKLITSLSQSACWHTEVYVITTYHMEICCILHKQAWIYTSFILWWSSFLCVPVASWFLVWSTSARWNSWRGPGLAEVDWWSDLLLSCWRYESGSNDCQWQLTIVGKVYFICSENKESDSHHQWLTALGRDYLECCVNWDPIKRAAAQIVSPSSWRWLSLLSGNYRCCHWFSLLQRCHENTLQMECQGAVTGNSWGITSQHRLKWWHLCKNIES